MKQNGNRKTVKLIAIVLISLLLNSGTLKAQESESKRFSFGFIVGDPLGVTMKYRLGNAEALDISFGADYFGSPRLQIDNVWQFNPFHSNVVKPYAGAGLAVAFARGSNLFFSKEPKHESFALLEDNKFGLGVRAIFGLSITPESSPLEFFVETGPLVGLNSILETDIDGAIGLRVNL